LGGALGGCLAGEEADAFFGVLVLVRIAGIDWPGRFRRDRRKFGLRVDCGALGFGDGPVDDFGCGRRVSGDFFDLGIRLAVEPHVARILGRDVEGANDQLGALDVEGIADESVDDFHERGLDGLGVFEHGDGMEAREGRTTDAAMGLLVEVTELLSAESGGAATDSADSDMSA
jgi:hypothetical protein